MTALKVTPTRLRLLRAIGNGYIRCHQEGPWWQPWNRDLRSGVNAATQRWVSDNGLAVRGEHDVVFGSAPVVLTDAGRRALGEGSR